jgi:hypothetical protein
VPYPAAVIYLHSPPGAYFLLPAPFCASKKTYTGSLPFGVVENGRFARRKI